MVALLLLRNAESAGKAESRALIYLAIDAGTENKPVFFPSHVTVGKLSETVKVHEDFFLKNCNSNGPTSGQLEPVVT